MGKRTERAALLIQELQKADSLEEKTVMLAYALSVIEKNARNDSEWKKTLLHFTIDEYSAGVVFCMGKVRY